MIRPTKYCISANAAKGAYTVFGPTYLFTVVAKSNRVTGTSASNMADVGLKGTNLLILLVICYLRIASTGNPAYTLEYESPESCKRMEKNGVHYYFNTTKLRCMPCSQNSTLQTASSNGLFLMYHPG